MSAKHGFMMTWVFRDKKCNRLHFFLDKVSIRGDHGIMKIPLGFSMGS
jgi:hypothetical protein